jgi:predicted translin family RNA/ssDNA-binding protein
MSISTDISGIYGWRYQRQISPGIQEFIEAFSFERYVQQQRLVSFQEVAEALPKEVLLTEEDYLLGLYDLTGEMMRFAVTAMATGGGATSQSMDGSADSESRGGLPKSQSAIVVDLRAMRARFEALNIPHPHGGLRDVHKKAEVMQASVEKVEKAAYGVLVRGQERPGGWVPDLSAPEVESF